MQDYEPRVVAGDQTTNNNGDIFDDNRLSLPNIYGEANTNQDSVSHHNSISHLNGETEFDTGFKYVPGGGS